MRTRLIVAALAFAAGAGFRGWRTRKSAPAPLPI